MAAGAALYFQREERSMRRWWLVGGLWLVACGLPGGGMDGERALADLQDSAVSAFVLGRSEGNLPTSRLEYTAGGIYSVVTPAGEAARLSWQLRGPRADSCVLR